jgi:hypothetical protein
MRQNGEPFVSKEKKQAERMHCTFAEETLEILSEHEGQA